MAVTVKDFGVSSVTDSSITIRLMLSNVTSDVTIKAFIGGKVEYTYGPITFAEHTFSDLQPTTYYSVGFSIYSNGALNDSRSKTVYTLPVYATSIVSEDEVYVNSDETISVEASVLPNNATSKKVRFSESGQHAAYSLLSTSYDSSTHKSYAEIYGHSIDEHEDYLVAKSDDGIVTKKIYVHACAPATDLVCSVSEKRIPLSGQYTVTYQTTPYYTTDTSVSFASSDTSVATVSSTGVVTPVSTGETTITVTLARRAISEHGVPYTGTSLTATMKIVVKNDPSFNGEWLEIPFTYLHAYEVEGIYDNLWALRNVLNGYSSISIPQFDGLYTDGRLTPVSKIKPYLNQVEDAIDKIYDATKNIEDDYIESANEYYDAPVTWGDVVTDGADRTRRWQNYINMIYSYCVSKGLID